MPPDVLFVCGNAVHDRVGSAYLLKLWGHLAEIAIRIITTGAADELKRVRVAAFWVALYNARGLAAKHYRPVMPCPVVDLHSCPAG
jgi:hypothetical protein